MLGRSVPPASVEYILAAVVGAAVIVAAVDIQHLVDQAGAEDGGQCEVSGNDIGDDFAPALQRGGKGEEAEQRCDAEPCYPIDRTDIFDHKDAPLTVDPAPVSPSAPACAAQRQNSTSRRDGVSIATVSAKSHQIA